jgi:hypothetical protein
MPKRRALVTADSAARTLAERALDASQPQQMFATAVEKDFGYSPGI